MLFRSGETAPFRLIVDRGWTYVGKCNGGGPIVSKPGNVCLSNQAPGVTVPVGSFATTMSTFAGYNTPAGIYRHRTVDRYSRPLPVVASPWSPKFLPVPPLGPYVPPVVGPQIDPFRPPGIDPIAPPAPVPWPVIPVRPLGPGGDATTVGPNPKPPRPVEPIVEVELPPISPPVTVTPSPPTTPPSPPAEDRSRRNWPRLLRRKAPVSKRPPKGTRERKATVLGIDPRSLVGQIYNGLTEGLDFVDVLFQALPERMRDDFMDRKYRFTIVGVNPETGRPKWRYTPPDSWEKIEFVYKHLDDLDPVKAIEGFLYEQSEDKVYGTIGKEVAKANKIRNLPHGWTFGPAL